MKANIFGLHIGCKVIFMDGDEYTITGNDIKDLVKIKGVKLLLTPLSKITKEDKRAFEKAFGYSPGVLCFMYRDDDLWNLAGNGEIFVKSTASEKFWVRSKGYDIPDGLVPEEYKEVIT